MAFQPIPGSGSGSGSSSNSGFQFLNSPFGDTTYTKVFVGGLAWETQSETLRQHFEQFGEILEAVVINDKNTGRSKGYGFVTFSHPDSARRACDDPNPIIDGRRANCNLASRGRPRPSPPYGHLRSASPYFGVAQGSRGSYVRSPTYHQPVPYSYQQGFLYPPYGYTAYGPEYAYPQSIYSPYMGQQYLQIYGVPGAVNTAVYPYGQLGQSLPAGHGYASVQGYAMPGQHIVQFSGPTAAPLPTIQASYPAGLVAPVPAQPQYIVPAHSPQFTQGSGSDQTAGFQFSLANYHLCILEVTHSHGHRRPQSRQVTPTLGASC
ncbi:RNA-binding protein 38-like protein [Cinnamomum micranthum f. kanehirae]|uniref:RNA-binding protein 38-like protein n=1 Tax=Cinnamomum micranthum f. kanehirae TaxID=337451 RepID=A0A3S3MA90_9MAGN|nr:RNA-binding protein 38-like protein [Cinnamomum micranthum f. kanehirae]